ncbi:uncharacterized protein LOC144663231 [Oculina patagonica]
MNKSKEQSETPIKETSTKEVSTLDVHKSSQAVGAEDTGYISENEVSEVTFNNGEMNDHSLAVTGSSATNISMPIEKASKLVVHELSEGVATEELEASGIAENEINECSCVICKVSDHCLAVSRSFARYISMPVEKVSPQDVHESSEAVAAKQAGNMGESHVSASSKLPYYVNANSEEDTVPAVSRDELCGNEAVKDNSNQSDSSHVCASSKLPYNVHDNFEKTVVSAISKDELCGNESAEDNSAM